MVAALVLLVLYTIALLLDTVAVLLDTVAVLLDTVAVLLDINGGIFHSRDQESAIELPLTSQRNVKLHRVLISTVEQMQRCPLKHQLNQANLNSSIIFQFCSNGVHPKYHKESAQSIISIHILTSECTLCPALELDMPGTF